MNANRPHLQLSIIIVNLNVKYFLEQCLCSVLKACRNIDAEIFVVDNGSTDGSRAFLETKFPTVKFSWNSSNAGFAKANNQALADTNGKYILFINPDTIVPEDCFEKCFEFLAAHPDAGAIGVRMVDGSGKFLKESKRAFPSPLTSLYKLAGLTRLFPRSKIFAKYYLGHLSEKENHEVDVLAGAFMMIPKKVIDTTGSFDEIFFMYGEDVDLSYRIQKTVNVATGMLYKNFYFSGTSIIHFKGESTKKGGLNYVRLFYNAMSLFVKKQYSSSRAGVFNFFVQLAIWTRAAFSAAGKILQRIGLPLLDAAIILLSFWMIKYLWNTYIRKDVNYSPNMLIIAFPVFAIIFLIIAYYSGLYDKGYRQKQLNRSTLIASLVLLSGYALLPEDLRFSRGILVFGIIAAFILMLIMRRLFIQWNLLEESEERNESRQTIVAANENDFLIVTGIMQNAGMHERVLGRVSNDNVHTGNSLGGVQQLPELIKRYPVKEVIFCEDGLSFAAIISIIQELPGGIRNKFHASGSASIIGSDSKYASGNYVTNRKNYGIDLPLNRRLKNLLDEALAFLFLISFPIHLLLQKRRAHFFKNVFDVLFGKKTWIGYAGDAEHLPRIKRGVLTPTALPSSLNELPKESLDNTDEWYAQEYSAGVDLEKIWRGYKYLGY